MAKTSMIERELKRAKLVDKYRVKRDALRAIMKSHTTSDEEKWDAQILMQKMPRDASPSRRRNRCQMTGRPHGVFERFKLSRNVIRRAAMRGDIPGLKKASW